MTPEQLAECDKLHNFFKNYILKQYNIKTTYHMIAKYKTGYRLLRTFRLISSKIFSMWELIIDVSSGECNIKCNKPLIIKKQELTQHRSSKITSQMRSYLIEKYEHREYPSLNEVNEMSNEINLSEKQIRHWFIQRRFFYKKELE